MPAGLAAVLAVGGCSASSKEGWADSTNKECDSINERFNGDLAYGDGIARDDAPKRWTSE